MPGVCRNAALLLWVHRWPVINRFLFPSYWSYNPVHQVHQPRRLSLAESSNKDQLSYMKWACLALSPRVPGLQGPRHFLPFFSEARRADTPLQPLRELPGYCRATPTLPRALSSLRVAGASWVRCARGGGCRALPGGRSLLSLLFASCRALDYYCYFFFIPLLVCPIFPSPFLSQVDYFFFPLFSGLAHEPPRELPEKDQQRWL